MAVFLGIISLSALHILARGQSQFPSIEADDNGIKVNVAVGQSVQLKVGDSPSSSLLTSNEVSNIVSSAVQAVIDKDYATNSDLDKLTQTVQLLNTTVIKLGQQVNCDPPGFPENGTRTTPPIYIPGVTVRFSCNVGYTLVGASEIICLANGTFSASEPTCAVAALLGQKENPAMSCKDVYNDYVKFNSTVKSGPQWLKHGENLFRVYCDMNTSTRDGLSGWTLCGKYHARKPGSQYLSYGFGRKAVGGDDDMTALPTFANKWASIDCRPLLADSSFMMHVGTNQPKIPYAGGATRFTNMFEDAKLAPENFFDNMRKANGVCKQRNFGAVHTYNETWDELKRDGTASGIQGLSVGGCLIGDGHHLCSYGRSGARFSNAGSESCDGSEGDTVYWAWDTDSHGCNNFLRIGTGCQKQHSSQKKPGTATFTYNFLFIR